MAIQKHRFVLCIETDNVNISRKYPNWCFNYTTPQEFAEVTAGMRMGADVSKKYGVIDDQMKKYGFRVSVERYIKPWY